MVNAVVAYYEEVNVEELNLITVSVLYDNINTKQLSTTMTSTFRFNRLNLFIS